MVGNRGRLLATENTEMVKKGKLCGEVVWLL